MPRRVLFCALLCAGFLSLYPAFAQSLMTLPPMTLSKIHWQGQIHEGFPQDLKQAYIGLQSFVARHGWQLPEGLIQEVRHFESKTDFDRELIALSQGQMQSVPPTYVGLMDNKILRVVSWSAYQQIHPEDRHQDYVQLLQHEMAHQFHSDLVGEASMGPVWFYEGFAVLAANQYPEAPTLSKARRAEILATETRGNYREYGALIRELIQSHPLPTLVQWAKTGQLKAHLKAAP